MHWMFRTKHNDGVVRKYFIMLWKCTKIHPFYLKSWRKIMSRPICQ